VFNRTGDGTVAIVAAIAGYNREIEEAVGMVVLSFCDADSSWVR
jgi:hypothetical protein